MGAEAGGGEAGVGSKVMVLHAGAGVRSDISQIALLSCVLVNDGDASPPEEGGELISAAPPHPRPRSARLSLSVTLNPALSGTELQLQQEFNSEPNQHSLQSRSAEEHL